MVRPRAMLMVALWTATLLRIVLIPVFVSFGLAAQEQARSGLDAAPLRWGALGVLLFMGLTDAFDGWLARRYSLTSQAGATVDAVADKLVQVALVAFLALSVGPVFTPLPLWFLIIVFGRDLVLLVGFLMLRARYGPLTVVHRAHGRAASRALSVVLLWAAFGLPAWGLSPLMVIAATIAVWSGTRYALDGAAQGEVIAGRG